MRAVFERQRSAPLAPRTRGDDPCARASPEGRGRVRGSAPGEGRMLSGGTLFPALNPDDFRPETRKTAPAARPPRPGFAARQNNPGEFTDEETTVGRHRARLRPRPFGRGPGADQARHRRADHRAERVLRGATEERRRAGGRGHQRRRRRVGPENSGFRRRRRVGPQAGRLGGEQVRRRGREMGRGPLQLGRVDPGLGRLSRRRHHPGHAGLDQPEVHGSGHVEHVPHLRP